MKKTGLLAVVAVVFTVMLLPFAAALEVIYQDPSTIYFVRTGAYWVEYSSTSHNDTLSFAFLTRSFPTGPTDTDHINQNAVRVSSLDPNYFVFQKGNESIYTSTIYYVTSGLDAFHVFYQDPSTEYFSIESPVVSTMDGNFLGFAFVQRTFPTNSSDIPPVEDSVRVASMHYAGAFKFPQVSVETIWYTIPGSVMLLTPNGGELWQTGSLQTISWSHPLSANTSGAQNLAWAIGLYRPSGAAWAIATIPITQSSFVWSIPQYLPYASDYKVKVSLVKNCIYNNVPCREPGEVLPGGSTDESNSQFAIVNANQSPKQYGDGTYVLKIGEQAKTTNGLFFTYVDAKIKEIVCVRAPCPPLLATFLVSHICLAMVGFPCTPAKELELIPGETKEIELDGIRASISFNRVVDASMKEIEVTVKSGTPEQPPQPPQPPQEQLELTIPIYSGWNMFSTPFSTSTPFVLTEVSTESRVPKVTQTKATQIESKPAATASVKPAVTQAATTVSVKTQATPSQESPPATQIVLPVPVIGAATTTCKDGPLYVYKTAVKKYEKVQGFVDGRAFIQPLIGYWFKNAGGECSITVKGLTKIVLEGLQLQAGWNLIGGPFNPTAFNEVKGDCTLASGPWYYNAVERKYEKTQLFEPGKAYLLKVENACELGESRDIPPLPEQNAE